MTKINKIVSTIKNKLIPKKGLRVDAKIVRSTLLFLLLLGVSAAVYQYGFIAIANGRYISRIEYIKNMEKQAGKQTLDQMVTESLILSEADKKKVKIEQSEIDGQIAKIEEQIKAQGQTLEAALSAEGMKRSDLEKQIQIQMLVEKLSSSTTEVTQAQIDEFLKANKSQLPAKATKDELQTLAKDQLENQAKNEAITNWLADLKKEAKIIYH